MSDRELRELERRAREGDAGAIEALEHARARAGIKPHARIATSFGDMVAVLFPEDAPRHVAAFRALVDKGFYDGLIFHRVVADFVIQGGCPRGNGTGGPGYTLKAEFNARPLVRGTVAMARAMAPDSAGSQFFIVQSEASVRHLTEQQTVFGQLVSGLETLDAIARVPVGPSHRPRQPVVMRIKIEFPIPEAPEDSPRGR